MLPCPQIWLSVHVDCEDKLSLIVYRIVARFCNSHWAYYKTIYLQFFDLPQRSWGKVMFSAGRTHDDSVSQGGVCLSACWDTHPPGGDYPPELDTPREHDTPPRADTPLEQTPLLLIADTSPQSIDPPPLPSEHCWEIRSIRAGGTHPTGMQSCFGLDVKALLILIHVYRSF